jgi:spore coat polysaccharide biosynthesis protein SpsF
MILAVLQARMSSTRLPGKVLKPILGRPMMGRQIDRVLRSRRIDRLVVATSRQAEDDAVAEFCAADGVPVYRGPLDDVLARVRDAAERFGPAEHVVRLTADCPLSDWTVIDSAIDLHLRERADISGNAVKRSYPDGLDVEVMTSAALRRAAEQAKAPDEREHVTPYFYRHPALFRLAHLVQAPDLAALRWTVDTAEDFRMIQAVFAELLPEKEDFVQCDILELLRARPDIGEINSPSYSPPRS